jgi:3-oxoacid CoA-transferase subunit B
MEHTTREGGHRIVKRCALPLTGLSVVDLIVTEMAVIEVTAGGLLLSEVLGDASVDAIRAATGASLHLHPALVTSRGAR